MNKKIIFRSVLLSLFLIFLSAVFFLAIHRRAVLQSITELVVNQNTKDLFAGSVRIEKVVFDQQLRIRLEGICGNYQTRQGPVPVEIRSLASLDPLLWLFTEKPVRFVFEGVRLRDSFRPGIFGGFSYRGGKSWRFELSADLNETGLEDLRWVDPQNLSGATGTTTGKITFVQSAGREPLFGVNLEAPKPGGLLQARFFDIFLPYLPVSVEKERVAKLASEDQRLVKYQTAGLEVTMPESDQMKILLRILVLDYNLKLTINATIRTDSKNAFSQVARIMGLIEVKTS